MKRIVELDTKSELDKCLDEQLFVFANNYHYTGKLIAINNNFIILQDPYIVYSTGDWDNKQWSDCQKLPTKELHIMLSAVESYFITKVEPI